MTPTPEMIARAELIADAAYTRGSPAWHGARGVALAAIMETSERAAARCDHEITRIFSTTSDGHGSNTAKRLRNAIRNGEHLK